MGFARNVIGLLAVSCGLYYLTSASSLTDNGKWTLIGATFFLTIVWVLMGNRTPNRITVSTTNQQESEAQDEEE